MSRGTLLFTLRSELPVVASNLVLLLDSAGLGLDASRSYNVSEIAHSGGGAWRGGVLASRSGGRDQELILEIPSVPANTTLLLKVHFASA